MRTIRLTLLTCAALAGVLLAAGRPWYAVPLCLFALLALGELSLRALPGIPPEQGLPAARIGMAAIAGLVTLPLVALSLHACGLPVRTTPLVIGETAVALVASAATFFRERRVPATDPHQADPHHADPGTTHRGGLPSQRSARSTNPSSASPASASPASASPYAEISRETGHDSAGEGPRRGGFWRTGVAVLIPVIVALGVGGMAARIYEAAPRPSEPGYLSVALGGWAAGIEAPVTVPGRGLAVPVRVTSSGIGDVTTTVRLRVGGRVVAAKRVTVAADTVRSFTVRVPAVPQDGCLHPVNISVGRMSAGFYARGPVTVRTRTAAFSRSGAKC
ncbi:hypothetical protein ACTI_07010 [Actinoplanes sp. OR16]|uniref:hypothetical protein n=1 Tax=Actinoplanes sp. OR16 TaxID=946334 RepID=UPI000F6E836C|nr:hypothetical protein [Actinoplanes sp. OR16]BBH64016.1 hypothetical protein ACTI_07010 [Actinoplanes sp. OR16]